MKNYSLKIVALCACLLLANGLFQWLVDSNMGVCWTHDVLRNWDQFGLVTLKGKLVQNPGGHDALDQPDVYPGHRPTSLYPAYLTLRLFGWTNLYLLPYHFLTTLALLVSIAWLLGGTTRGIFWGGIAILCPGYIVEPTAMDPNAVAILSGIPYAALLFWQLNRPQLKAANYILLALLTFAFTSLNWTTALIHAQIFLTLLICRTVSFPRLAYYLAIGAASAGLVLAIALAAKLSGGKHESGAFGELLGSYMWGSKGYSDGSDARTLLVRLAFTNVLALLPLWLVLAWNWFSRVRASSLPAFISLVPLFMAMLETVIMRNYFSHHPWMAAPLLLVGWTLTMKLLIRLASAPAAENKPSPREAIRLWKPAWSAGLLLAFGFGLAILLVNRVHWSPLYSLVALVRQDSLRADQIVIVENRDPALASEVTRLSETFDRQVALVDSLPAPQNGPSGAMLLSAVPLGDGWHESGRTKATENLPLIGEVINWFTTHISKRKPGDKMELAETYYLYFATPPSKYKWSLANGDMVSWPGRTIKPRVITSP